MLGKLLFTTINTQISVFNSTVHYTYTDKKKLTSKTSTKYKLIKIFNNNFKFCFIEKAFFKKCHKHNRYLRFTKIVSIS